MANIPDDKWTISPYNAEGTRQLSNAIWLEFGNIDNFVFWDDSRFDGVQRIDKEMYSCGEDESSEGMMLNIGLLLHKRHLNIVVLLENEGFFYHIFVQGIRLHGWKS